MPTWPNVQTIRLALEAEAALCGADVQLCAAMIVEAARELSLRPQYSCPAEWEIREIFRENSISRFWFEDARWRSKRAYITFRERLRDQRETA